MAFLLYRKDRKLIEFPKWVKSILFVLRFLLVSCVAALLLSPLVKYFSKTIEKPIIILAHDNSASMLMAKDSSFIAVDFQNQLKQLQSQLAQQYEVESYQFDEKVSPMTQSLDFEGKLSDFDVLFEELENKYANRNIGGLVLISDGIYNQGSNPIRAAEQIDYPIFSIATGDTTAYVDAQISNVRNNKLAFLGNDFPLEFDVKVQKAKVKSLKVSVSKGGVSLHSETLIISKSNQLLHLQMNLKANLIGKQKYTVEVATIEGERNILNNSVDFYIDVLDGRQKVLLLGTAPHPDLAAIREAITINENYELKTSLFEKFDEPLDGFDLVILHQTANARNLYFDQKLQKIIDANQSVLLIGGGWQNIEDQFGIKYKLANRNLSTEAQVIFNDAFTLFTVDESLKQLKDFPPLTIMSARISNPNSNATLFYQKIGAVKTKYPLLSFFDKDGKKIARFVGEGFWRWRMTDYVENRNHDKTNLFISKIVQYLAVKSDRSLFQLSTADEYFENESINFYAQLFNPSYELINDPEVSLLLTNEEGNEFQFSLNRTINTYQLSIASLSAGEYSYIASASFQGKVQEEKGKFTVKKLQLEKMNSEAKHNLMYQLAEKSGGQLLSSEELKKIPEIINQREDIAAISYLNEEVEDIINLKWIFFVLLALLSIEWFIRKRGGAY
ncbi:MAG: hypothetical protein JKY48_07190 [Flavobacteriales bacterium]|nr:hypothetical protein [Flavobacteriales bacterium]